MSDSLARPLLNSGEAAIRPRQLRFSRASVIRGLALMSAGLLCFGVAAVLAKQRIPWLDDGMKRADMLTVLTCFFGIVLLFAGSRLILSRVVMTATELSLEPQWCGFRAEWPQIREWLLEDHPERGTTELFVWVRLDDQPRRISSSWLEPADFQLIITVLQYHRATASQPPVAT